MLWKELKKTNKRLGKLLKKYEEVLFFVKNNKELEKRILEIYRVVFNNFSSKRVFTNIKIPSGHPYRSYQVVLNRGGVSLIIDSGLVRNSRQIWDFGELVSVCKEWKKIINYVKRKRKKRILKSFCKELSKIDYITSKKLDVDIKIYDEELRVNNVSSITYGCGQESKKFVFGCSDGNFSHSFNIYFPFLNLRGKLIVEQAIKPLSELLDRCKKDLKKYNRQLKKCEKNLMKKFSSYLILEKIKEK